MMLSAHLPKHTDGLLDFSELDAKHKGIRIINIVPVSLRFISKLYLDGNYLLSLSGIEQFYNLEILHFNFNLISLPTQLNKIANPFFIQQLSFISNPIYDNTAITHEYFKKKGFSRLEVLNPSHHLISHKNKLKKQIQAKQQNLNISTELTAKRKSRYNEEESQMKTSRKKMIGRLYNPQMLTKRTRGRQQKAVFNTKQTKQSTERHRVVDSPVRNGQSIENSDRTQQISIKPFETEMQEYDETAKFSGQDTTMKIGEQFIEQQKQHLSMCFYERVLLQKCFATLKRLNRLQDLNKELQQQQGKLLNNSIQTYRFSLIKLQHQMIKYR